MDEGSGELHATRVQSCHYQANVFLLVITAYGPALMTEAVVGGEPGRNPIQITYEVMCASTL